MLTDFEDYGPKAKRFHAESKLTGVERHGINVEQMTKLMTDVGFASVAIERAWTMPKMVEKFPGEFGAEGKPQDDSQGEKVDVPFVLCYGERQR